MLNHSLVRETGRVYQVRVHRHHPLVCAFSITDALTNITPLQLADLAQPSHVLHRCLHLALAFLVIIRVVVGSNC